MSGSGEVPAQPPRVDFVSIADLALRSGVFVVDPEIVARREADPSCKMPISPLELPYGNGPVRIDLEGEDVPRAAMHAVRKNFRKAGEWFMTEGTVALYFHERFMAGDILHSPGMQDLVAAYKAHTQETISDLAATSEIPSFKVDDPLRKVHNRKLFTQEELMASWDFSVEHPGAVVSVIAYKRVMLDYFANIRQVYESRADASLKLFDNYVRQWETDNFTDSIVPALTVLCEEARRNGVGEPILDQAMFSRALEFTIANGGFQNRKTIPADIALDGKERVNQFVCPAVGPINDQLGDGAILARIYAIISNHTSAGDTIVRGMLEHVKQDAWDARNASEQQLAEKSRQEYLENCERAKHCDATIDGRQLALRMDWDEYGQCLGDYTEGDVVISFSFADTMTDVVKRAVATVSQTGRPAFFAFNEKGYRFTLARLRAIAWAQHPDMFTEA